MEALLKPLASWKNSDDKNHFDRIIFCPNMASVTLQSTVPGKSLCLSFSFFIYHRILIDVGYGDVWVKPSLSHQHALKTQWMQLLPHFPSNKIYVLSSVEEALYHLYQLQTQINVLVTGSLHLVGALFRALHLSLEDLEHR
jgi:hypothetical protein